MIRFVKYDENLCLNDKIYRMMIVLYDKICKRWQKGINRDFTESEWDLVFIESN